MTDEEEKKAIEYLKKFIEIITIWAGMDKTEMSISFKTILNLIEKKDKMIDLMAEEMKNKEYEYEDMCLYSEDCHGEYCEKCIKEYFRKKVEKDD